MYDVTQLWATDKQLVVRNAQKETTSKCSLFTVFRLKPSQIKSPRSTPSTCLATKSHLHTAAKNSYSSHRGEFRGVHIRKMHISSGVHSFVLCNLHHHVKMLCNCALHPFSRAIAQNFSCTQPSRVIILPMST